MPLNTMLRRLAAGKAVTPDFVGLPWKRTAAVAVRGRVVRRVRLTEPCPVNETLAEWIVVSQVPDAGTAASIGSEVTLILHRTPPPAPVPGSPGSADDLGGASG